MTLSRVCPLVKFHTGSTVGLLTMHHHFRILHQGLAAHPHMSA